MLFNSIAFLIFLIIILATFYICPKKYRHYILLIGSYIFYMCWNIYLIFLILITTLVAYGGSLLIKQSKSDKFKKIYLISSILICLGILIFFKYINFIFSSMSDFLNLIRITNDPIVIKLILPVGISFYTFQTLSYVIDVYKGKIEAEKNPFYFALYVSFFPQLVAGPIERPESLLPQLKNNDFSFNENNFIHGLKIMLVGFTKKILIADFIGIYVNNIFSNIQSSNSLLIIIGAILFSIQILCDFSGYSDIAVGTAKLFNINLMENFNSPYSSTSIKEFWSRWHISLSSWFKDYIYIPLGGNRKGKLRWALNILIVFIISGLWHGASYTFLLWGLMHAVFQIVGNFTLPYRNRLLSFLHISPESKGIKIYRTIMTFLLISFAFISFRSNNVNDMIFAYKSLFTNFGFSEAYFSNVINVMKVSKWGIFLIIILICILNKIDILKNLSSHTMWKSILLKALYICIAWAIIICFIYLQSSNVPSSFIYFQF